MMKITNKNLKVFFIFLLIGITSSYSQKNGIIRVDTKTFFDGFISKKNYSINTLLTELENSKQYKTSLINKGLRFKMFFDSQDIAIKVLSNKCKSYSSSIKIENILIKSKFKQGINNANRIFDYSMLNISNFKNDYNKIKIQLDHLKDLYQNDISNCKKILSDLKLRKLGFFDEKNQQNIISFNYITNPVNEILNGFTSKFSTISTAPNENFILTLDLPKSWTIRDKTTFSSTKTVGLFEPYENFLSPLISITFHNIIATENEMKLEKVTDKQLVEELYNDDEFLELIVKKSNTKIPVTLFNNGKDKFILYNIETDLSKKLNSNLVDNNILKSIVLIGIKNGMLYSVTFGSSKNEKGFNSFDYYSKLFLKVLTSVKTKDIEKDIIYLTEKDNMKNINVEINNKKYFFLLDTGATNTIINKEILNDLLISGQITRDNFINKSMYKIADGSYIEVENWIIPKMKIGNKIIKNIEVAVIEDNESSLLFGLSSLTKLNIIKLDLNNNEIKINLN